MHQQLTEARVGGGAGEQETHAPRVEEDVLGLHAALVREVPGGVQGRGQLPIGRHVSN